ncbi:MAG: hypothetical protein GY845_34060 [Planctomycetes bacterium]|nr:hypothetical protein [Planctomycetota bacterium]
MRHSACRILKESEVKVDGQFTLDIVQAETANPSEEPAADLGEPQVRIAESQAQFSVIEITCSCGMSMHLRCEHDGVKAAKISEQKAEPEIAEKKAEPEMATVSN